MISDDVIQLQKLFYQTHDYTEKEYQNKLLVLGIGNYLMGDEGVGVHVIHALSKTKLPDRVDIIDGGTGSFDLMPILAKYPLVIFIDATMDGRPPGTIDVIYPKFAKDFPTVLSAHDVGLKDMIDALEFKGELPEIILLTISIKEMIPMTTELTEEIQKSIPEAVKRIKNILDKIKIIEKNPDNQTS
ncbi:MAG: hydrogenase maturation protease [Chlorobi bacterium]|nr:hydrogenase maturation protease [Chlorobiota bacterium]